MTSQPDYIKYLESAKSAEIAERLRSEGIEVSTEVQRGNVRFDIIARRGDQKIAYEIKAVTRGKNSKEHIRRLQDAARAEGLEFRLLLVNPPRKISIEIDEFASQLLNYLINVEFPTELYSLASQVYLENVSDVEVSSLHVTSDGIRVEGSGTLEVQLVYGGGGEDGLSNSDSYPFTFDVLLDHENKISGVSQLHVNTDSFYE